MKSFVILSALVITTSLFASPAHAFRVFWPTCNINNANEFRCIDGYLYRCALNGVGSTNPNSGKWEYRNERCQPQQ